MRTRVSSFERERESPRRKCVRACHDALIDGATVWHRGNIVRFIYLLLINYRCAGLPQLPSDNCDNCCNFTSGEQCIQGCNMTSACNRFRMTAKFSKFKHMGLPRCHSSSRVYMFTFARATHRMRRTSCRILSAREIIRGFVRLFIGGRFIGSGILVDRARRM